MIWEVIGSKWANTIFELLVIAINTVVILILGHSAIIHLHQQVAIIGVVPVNSGGLAHTVLSEGSLRVRGCIHSLGSACGCVNQVIGDT